MTRIVGGSPSDGAQRRSGVLDAGTGEFEQFTHCVNWHTPTAVDGTPADPAREQCARRADWHTPTAVDGTPTDSARVRRRWILPAALAGGVAMVATAAALASDGRAGQPGTSPPSVLLVTTGIALELPAGWGPTSAAPALPGLDDAVAAGAPGGNTIVIGTADKTWSNRRLLPAGLRTSQKARTALLGLGAQAVRHDRVPVAGRLSTIYSLPTTKGVAALACFASADTCSAVASSLQITEGRVFALGPEASFATALGRILLALESRERPVAAQLRRADTRASQIAATKKLWWAYSGAAKSLRRLNVSPADAQLRRQLSEALRLAGCAYGRAAAHTDPARYAREGRIALAEQANATEARNRLRDVGYGLPAGAARFTPLPTLLPSTPPQ